LSENKNPRNPGKAGYLRSCFADKPMPPLAAWLTSLMQASRYYAL